jgi:hypothetical protein
VKLPDFVMQPIRRWAMNYMARRPDADFYIGGRADPYLIRWWVIPRNKWFNLYLHKIIKDDRDEALHDHPWINASLLVSGSYDEHTIAAGGIEYVAPLSEGYVRFRGPSSAHRLVVRQNEPVITLFFTGPVWRHWGFHCRNGWRHWKDFVGFRSDNENVVGRGCGEMDGPSLPGGRIPIFAPLMRSSGKRPD